MKYRKSLINFSKNPLFARIVLLAALIGITFFLKLSLNLSKSGTPNMATLAINFETEKRFFEGEVTKDMTMMDAISAAVSVGKIKLNYVIDELGNVKIVEIDGHIDGADSRHFVFYLNSNKVPPGDLNKKKIGGGDKIEIRNE